MSVVVNIVSPSCVAHCRLCVKSYHISGVDGKKRKNAKWVYQFNFKKYTYMKDLDTKTKDNDSILDDAVSNTIKKIFKTKNKR